MVASKLEDYLTLLNIRKSGKRRDTIISGSVFLLTFIGTITLGMLDRLSGRSLLFVTAMVVIFGYSFLTTWVKHEVIKGSIELIENLLLTEN